MGFRCPQVKNGKIKMSRPTERDWPASYLGRESEIEDMKVTPTK